MENTRRIDFITFNYTNTLEECLTTLPIIAGSGDYHNAPIHIHSTLGNSIILGLDDENLYNTIPCNNKRELKNFINKANVSSRTSDSVEHGIMALNNSEMVVILGWSMGDSDSVWVNRLKKCFSEIPNFDIVYVPYCHEGINLKNKYQQLNWEDTNKDWIQNKLEIPDEENHRVHIVTDPSYMKLDFLTKSIESEKELATV